jgi:glycyl-tRNA synthetase beta chain
VVEGVPAKSPDLGGAQGPRQRAGAGDRRLPPAGLDLPDAHVVKDEKKGDFYVVRIDKPGRAAKEIIGEVVPAVAARFPWPKSMRWGAGRTSWVRPLHSILCVLDGKVVPLAIEEVEAGKQTRGHRFHGTSRSGDEEPTTSRPEGAQSHLDPPSGRSPSRRALAKEHKPAGRGRALSRERWPHRWPLVLMGSFEEAFLGAGRVPDAVYEAPEVLSPSIRASKLANRFAGVELKSKDGGAQIIAGNEKVIPRAGRRQVLLGAGPQEAARRDGKRPPASPSTRSSAARRSG